MTATLDALPLARLITEQAYKAGASLVTTLFTDEQSALLRYRFAEDAGFDKAPGWLFEGMAECVSQRCGAAGDYRRRSVSAVKGRSGKSCRANRAASSKAYRPAIELDYPARYQLDDCRQRHAGVGGNGVS